MRLELSNFTPLKTIVHYLGGNPSTGTALRNLAGNVLAFVPMGWLLPAVFPRLQWVGHVAAVSCAVSLSLEVIQLLTGVGSFDVDDLLLNVWGAMIGWLMYRGFSRVLARLAP